MPKKKFDFPFIEKQIRSKTFGILNTINPNNSPQSSGILFGVSKPGDPFCIYLKTFKTFRKTKNIQSNPNVTFVIPVPHHILRFIPSSTIMIKGQAELVSTDSEEVIEAFNEKRILRMILQDLNDPEVKKKTTFIRIKPKPKILCYGVGFNVIQLGRAHTSVSYSVKIPEERMLK
jgi:general stress protein 26